MRALPQPNGPVPVTAKRTAPSSAEERRPAVRRGPERQGPAQPRSADGMPENCYRSGGEPQYSESPVCSWWGVDGSIDVCPDPWHPV